MDLLDLRKEIDKIDDQLIPLLQHRMDISRQVAAYKAERGLPVFNAEREGQILDCVKEKCGEDGDAIATVFSATMDASRAIQHNIMESGGDLRNIISSAVSNTNAFDQKFLLHVPELRAVMQMKQRLRFLKTLQSNITGYLKMCLRRLIKEKLRSA